MDIVGPKHISVMQAATRLRISEATVVRAVEQGLLKGHRDGNTWWVAEASITPFEDNDQEVSRLPLTADDIRCAECDEPFIRCECR